MASEQEQISWMTDYMHRRYGSSDKPSSQDMLSELCDRGIIPACPCGQKVTYISEGVSGDIYTLGCPGCRNRISKCRCPGSGRKRWWPARPF